LWHIASFRCDAEFGRYRGIADIEQAAPTIPDLWVRFPGHQTASLSVMAGANGRANAPGNGLRGDAIHCAKRAIY
jgi:hypothetical protein